MTVIPSQYAWNKQVHSDDDTQSLVNDDCSESGPLESLSLVDDRVVSEFGKLIAWEEDHDHTLFLGIS